MTFDPASRRTAAMAAMVADILDAGPKATRYFWAGVVLALIGVGWFASIPWLDWLGYGLGILFFFPGIGLVLKWKKACMRYQTIRDSWEEYFPWAPEVEDTTNSEIICVGSNGTHDQK